MRYDILLAGVGGQGVLSMAAIIGRAALGEGRSVKQSEVHGMAQRGGAVQAHLRLSDHQIESDLIALGTAQLILSLEPVESLRYLDYLSPEGTLVTSADPFRNIADYPDVGGILAKVRSLPRAVVLEAERIAMEAGDVQALNTVMVGAAATLLPLRFESIERAVAETFRSKGATVVAVNLSALRAGRDVAWRGEAGAGATPIVQGTDR
ncbi:MAG TPA: indolepyruvate oxidoreductase subunit beta [Candidatus Eisenbacteria bacterium]